MQFYMISEMNWSGNQEVAQWKYYSNGDFIDLDDTELRTKLLVAKNAENISWQLQDKNVSMFWEYPKVCVNLQTDVR